MKRGRVDAKAKGVKLGRKPKLTQHQKAEAITRGDKDGETLRSIGRSFNVSAATIQRLARRVNNIMRVRIAAIVALLVAASPARGTYWHDGNYWQRVCLSDRLGLHDFMDGVAEGVDNATSSVSGMKSLFCIPSGVTLQQLGDVFCGYVNQHPETRHFTGGFLAMFSLVVAFRCSK
jgi:hypothetical protein